MPSNSGIVPSNIFASQSIEGTGQKRSERLRARRDEAGLAQVSGWVPKERRAYAREVIAALASGANSLPPDPEQAAALEAAQAEAAAARDAEASARGALAVAEQHGQALTAELEATHADLEAAQQASRQAEASAVARVNEVERAREDALSRLRATEAAAAQASAEAERLQKMLGLRGQLARWLVR